MRRFVDLHTHSSASDGRLAPAELVALAERKRLAALALTDHDTVAGLAQAARAAEGLALRLIAGVEISSPFAGGTLHLLGLGIRPDEPVLRDTLRRMRLWRSRRNPLIIRKLQVLGIRIDMPELRRFAGAEARDDAVIGRLHIASLLVGKGVVADVEQAFGRYLAPGRPAYVDKERLPSRNAIAAIHAAGGLAVLAHPPQLQYGNLARLMRIVGDLVAEGLDGLEVYHPEHSLQQTRWYLDLARKLGVLVSGGSDYHGGAKPEVRLGQPAVPVAAVQQLLDRIGM